MTDLQLPTVNGMREGGRVREREGWREREGRKVKVGRKGVRGKEGCYNITILYHDIVPGV